MKHRLLIYIFSIDVGRRGVLVRRFGVSVSHSGVLKSHRRVAVGRWGVLVSSCGVSISHCGVLTSLRCVEVGRRGVLVRRRGVLLYNSTMGLACKFVCTPDAIVFKLIWRVFVWLCFLSPRLFPDISENLIKILFAQTSLTCIEWTVETNTKRGSFSWWCHSVLKTSPHHTNIITFSI